MKGTTFSANLIPIRSKSSKEVLFSEWINRKLKCNYLAFNTPPPEYKSRAANSRHLPGEPLQCIFFFVPSSCPAEPSGNFTPGEISTCQWHANGCTLVLPGLGTRIQLQSARRYMTTREMNAINGRCVSATLIFHTVF